MEGTKTGGAEVRFAPAAALTEALSEPLRRQTLNVPAVVLNLVVGVGTRVIGPPYDHSGSAGAAGSLPRLDGDMYALGGEGFSASGVSVVLSSPTHVLAAVTPIGTYDFSWAAFGALPRLRSRGGLGMLVYRNTDPRPLVEKQAVLWNLTGVTQVASGQGSGRFRDAVATSTGWGRCAWRQLCST